MKKIYLLMASMLSASTLALTGCTNDDAVVRNPLSQPSVSINEAHSAANSLMFQWSSVKDAVEYAYVLTDADGEYVGGGLGETYEYLNTTLLPGKEYTIAVTAYPLVGSDGLQSSSTVTHKAMTENVDIQTSINGSKMSMAWSNLIDVDSVKYTVTHAQTGESITATTTSTADYTADKMGSYVMSVTDYYKNGADYPITGCSYSFDFCKVTGKAYLDGLGKTIDANLTMNDDGTFTISNWYGGTKDITFSINDDATIEVLNAESITPDGKFYTVLTGRSNNEGDVYYVAINKAKSFAYNAKGNKSSTLSYAHGKISLYVVLSDSEENDVDNTSDDCMYTLTW